MGTGQSKLPYNVETPRRMKDLKCWEKKSEEFSQQTSGAYDKEFVGNLTAPEFRAFIIGAIMGGMAMAMDDPERGNKLNAKWKPWIFIVNESNETVKAELWMTWPTTFMEGEITILPGEIGRLPLPKEVDFNHDYPLNGIMNNRRIHLFFEDGQRKEVGCSRLNYGMSRGDFVIRMDRNIDVCEEIRDGEAVTEEEGDAEVSAELQDFLAECFDPNCPEVTEEQAQAIADFLKKCFLDSANKVDL